MPSTLYVIATPIGNLEDLSPRALRLLGEVDVLACEDTRRAKSLLAHFGIHGKKLISYHDPVEASKAKDIVAMLQAQNLSLGLISDAGTPCFADPGYRLLRLAREAGITVVPVPGASALTSLVSASGLASDRVLFVGFLPRKKEELRRELVSWTETRASVVFFEAAPRLITSLEMIQSVYPEAILCIGRELTKLHEELVLLPIADCLKWAAEHTHLKGEFALMLERPAVDREDQQDESLLRLKGSATQACFLLDKGLSHRDVVDFLLLSYEEIPRKKIYEWVQSLR